MHPFKKHETQITFISFALLIAGMFFIDIAPVLCSTGMISLLVLSILNYPPMQLFSNFFNRKELFIFSFSFLFLLPSVLYSANKIYWLDKVTIATPILALPFALASLKLLQKKEILTLFYFYFLFVLFTSAYAFLNYLFNQAAINQIYLQSQVMPTLVKHHPTFSLMVAFGICVAYYFWQTRFFFINPAEKYLFLAGGIFLFFFSHIFAVRSGLLTIYVLIFAEMYRYVFIKKQYKTGLVLVTIFITIVSVMYLLSPTLRNKIENTKEDLLVIKRHESADNRSLASRKISWQNAVEITDSSSWLFGCGLGDIDDLSYRLFTTKYPEVEKPIIPHNQFLYYLAATGITGLVVFCFSFFYPAFYYKKYSNPLLANHYTVLLLAFVFEAFLATQLGVAFSCTFIMLGLMLNRLPSN